MPYTNDTKPATTVNYLVTQALDNLMTEDSEYMVTQDSVTYNNDDKQSSTYTNDTL